MDHIKEQLQAMVETYGPEAVKTAAEQLLTDSGVKEIKVGPVVLTVSEDMQEAIQAFFEGMGLTLEGYGIAIEKAHELQQAREKGLPADYVPILAPHLLAKTLEQLEACGYAVEEAGSAKEAIYANKPDLVKQRWHLEGQIKALEAEAVMQIQYDGRDAYVMIGDQKQKLGNDTVRDAYRRTYSKDQRKQLADTEADIAEIEAKLLLANDNWQKAVESAAITKAKAGLQGALLNFLAARG